MNVVALTPAEAWAYTQKHATALAEWFAIHRMPDLRARALAEAPTAKDAERQELLVLYSALGTLLLLRPEPEMIGLHQFLFAILKAQGLNMVYVAIEREEPSPAAAPGTSVCPACGADEAFWMCSAECDGTEHQVRCTACGAEYTTEKHWRKEAPK